MRVINDLAPPERCARARKAGERVLSLFARPGETATPAAPPAPLPRARKAFRAFGLFPGPRVALALSAAALVLVLAGALWWLRRENGGQQPPAQLRVERSRREGQGDYSTNAAMLLAPALGLNPRQVAEPRERQLAGCAHCPGW